MSKPKLNITDLEYAFKLKPKEMIEFFNSKGLQTSYNWYEVYEEAHAKAFTVAKMTQLDLLKDTKDLTAQAIKEGWGKGEYQARANELFKKKGWSGFKTVTDKEGNEKQIELGTPRRIKNIYHSNMVSAQAASRYKQQLEDVDIAPYFQYQCTLDGRTRPEHRAMHGKVFRYDDPIWASLYPPNGWGCRCSVRSLTESELNRMGIKPEKSEDSLREIKTEVGGEEKTVQAYDFDLGGKQFTLKANPGWSYNVGTHAWNIDVQAWNKVKDMPTEVKDRFISEMAQNPHRGIYVENFIEHCFKHNLKLPRTEEITLTWILPNILKALQKENIQPRTPIVGLPSTKIYHAQRPTKNPAQKLTKPEYLKIYDYVNNADEIFIDMQEKKLIYVKFTKDKDTFRERNCILIPVKLNQAYPQPNFAANAEKVNYKEALSDKNRYKKIE